MRALAIFSVLCLLFNHIQAGALRENHRNDKLELLAEEAHAALGGNIQLTKNEIKANDILMALKYKELDYAFKGTEYMNFSKHYFTYRDDIPKSKVYQIIKRMPKGAALHVHSSLMLDVDVLVSFTYDPDLYICFGDEDFNLLFSTSVPRQPCKNQWMPLAVVRGMSDNNTKFDEELKQFFALHTQDPEDFINADINDVWKKFDDVYYAIKSLISYRPVREKYIYESLKKFYEDNIMYVEVRTGLHSLYELNGTTHDRKYLLDLYKRVTNKFKEDHPDFVGLKLILTKHRQNTETQVKEGLDLARALKAETPEMIAGFDLVGQEDLGKPLSYFESVLSDAKGDVDYFFHAGETAWNGMPTDENLFDAIVLGTKRIGHGYALIKHPSLMQAVIKKNIAIEANVISNNVLSLVSDVRNHPLAMYFAIGLPVVLSSDDPGVWGADPLSHDFYIAFMGVASRHADLRLLKKLALNSIEHSSLDDTGKSYLLEVFNKRWGQFIRDLIATPAYSMNG